MPRYIGKCIFIRKKTMKQLILTFFLVILCYSLFFDKKTENPTKDEINFTQEDAIIPYLPYMASDTVNLITLNNNPMVWNVALSGN